MRLEFLLENASARDKFERIWQRSVFLFTVLLLYLALGAVFFMAVEGPNRQAVVEEAEEDLDRERSRLLEVLWAESIAKTEDDWAEIANNKLDVYEQTVKRHALHGIDLDDGEVDDDNPWTLVGAFFYCYTVVTTIGYGNICPETTIGRLVTIPYACVGIPLMLIYLGEVGRALTLVLRAVLKRRWPHDYGDASEDSFDFTVIAAFSATGLFLVFGAFLFRVLQNADDWSVLDAAYFSFVTISTIGFGDLLPASAEWHQLLVLLAYSLASLSLCGMLFVVVQSRLEQQLDVWQLHWHGWLARWRQRRDDAARKKRDDADARRVAPVRLRSRIVEEDEYEVEEEEEED